MFCVSEDEAAAICTAYEQEGERSNCGGCFRGSAPRRLGSVPRRSQVGRRCLCHLRRLYQTSERPSLPAADDMLLRLWPVSRAVNSVRNAGPALLDRVDDPRAPPPSDAPGCSNRPGQKVGGGVGVIPGLKTDGVEALGGDTVNSFPVQRNVSVSKLRTGDMFVPD